MTRSVTGNSFYTIFNEPWSKSELDNSGRDCNVFLICYEVNALACKILFFYNPYSKRYIY